MKSLATALWLVLALGPLAALDWGGTLENSASWSGPGSPSLAANSSLSLWLNASFGDATFLVKANVDNSYSQTLAAKPVVTDTVGGDLDTLQLSAPGLRLGRGDYSDFSGVVLSTKLDGAQATLALPNTELRAFVGTSAALFKSGSTIILSEDDVKDRQVAENWQQPATLWAAPRAVGGVDAAFRQVLPDQNLRLSVLGQLDLRADQAKDGEQANVATQLRKGAPLSTAYVGAGWDGRVAGPVYASLWGYGVAGTSLTAVGVPVTVPGATKDKPSQQFQTWKASNVLGGLAGGDVSVLLPALAYLLVNVGVQYGTGDVDGAAPSDNKGTDASSMTPSTYTGWVGISRTGGSLVFSPQPGNVARAQVVASVRPWEGVQVASSTFAFARTLVAAISETGLKPASTDLYLGVESDLMVVWRPLSDVGGTLGVGVFVPNTQSLDRVVETKVQASINVSF